MPGMPYGFADLIARKYDILQQQADTQRLGVQAAANLDNVRAGLLPQELRMNQDRTAAEIGRTKADTASTLESTKYIGPLAKANIGLMGANAKEAGARTGLLNAQTTGENQINKLFTGGFRFSPDPLDQRFRAIMDNRSLNF